MRARQMLTSDLALRTLVHVSPTFRPMLLRRWVDSGALALCPDTALAVALAWTTGSPESLLPRETWINWFRSVGFTVDSLPAERPTVAVRLYRGCAPFAVRRMAWTSDPRVALGYARGCSWRRPGRVWSATCDPAYLLCYSSLDSEYVVDPCGLTDIRCIGS